VPALGFVVALLLAVVCCTVALVMLGLAAARVAGAPDVDTRAARSRLILHGAAVLALGGCFALVAEQVAPVAPIALMSGSAAWAVAAMVAGAVVAARAGRDDRREDGGGPEDDGGGGGGSPDDGPDPEPPWWPQFERDLLDWQTERESARSPR
jgi:hypothetical protein